MKKDTHRTKISSVRLYPDEKELVEQIAARQGRTVSNLIHGLLRAEAFRLGLEWPGSPIRFGRPKENKEENS